MLGVSKEVGHHVRVLVAKDVTDLGGAQHVVQGLISVDAVGLDLACWVAGRANKVAQHGLVHDRGDHATRDPVLCLEPLGRSFEERESPAIQPRATRDCVV